MGQPNAFVFIFAFMMKCLCLAMSALLFLNSGYAQKIANTVIFAHNDYKRASAFYEAYDLGVGFIEADVFLVDTAILVAHDKEELQADRSLENLYLVPLLKKVRQNGGYAYTSHNRTLTLMIDLKTEGVTTLNAIVEQLHKYPELTSAYTLRFMISGNVPDPGLWAQYPDFITFDGRPGIAYTQSQLNRIAMISTSFPKHVRWDGKEKLSDEALDNIDRLMKDAHAKQKPFRFWATPDFENAWRELMRLQMDVIVTDKVTALSQYLRRQN